MSRFSCTGAAIAPVLPAAVAAKATELGANVVKRVARLLASAAVASAVTSHGLDAGGPCVSLVASARADIAVLKARIGCLDLQRDDNLGALVARACDGKSRCAYRAPTPSQYRSWGVQAATRLACTQAMEIVYRCGVQDERAVMVPGNAWEHLPAELACDAAASAPPRPGIAEPITVLKARIGCLDIQTSGNLTSMVADACDGRGSCSFKAPTEAEYRRAGVWAETRTACTQAMEIAYQCGYGRTKVATVPGDAWTHPAASLGCGCDVAPSPRPARAKPLLLVALGDSIMWGQGLPEAAKFRNVVAGWLHQQTGRPVLQVSEAHSGARIRVDAADGDRDARMTLSQEIPSPWPSVTKQVDLATCDVRKAGYDASDVDLVLVDGCINDVGVLTVIDPAVPSGHVTSKTVEMCSGRMQSLLRNVLESFPAASVILAGYYQIASPRSSALKLGELFSALAAGTVVGAPVAALVGGVVAADRQIANSAAFAAQARQSLSLVVAQYGHATGGPFPGLRAAPGAGHVALAWPDFRDENAYGAGPDTYLFTVGEFGTDEARGAVGKHPEAQTTLRGVAYSRAQACAASDLASPACLDASMGHPNERGAHAYADAIVTTLQARFWRPLGLPRPPPPYPLVASVVEAGRDLNGPRQVIGGRTVQLRDWMVVRASDGDTGAAVDADVRFGSAAGRTEQRFYHPPCVARVNVPRPRTQIRSSDAIIDGEADGCAGVVSAPGYQKASVEFPP